MTDIVRDAIAAELARLQRVARTPAPPLGYGSDLSCAEDLTPRMDVVDPFSTRAIGEAIARRLDTPRGSLPGSPDYGIDLRSYLNRGTTAAEINSLADRIRVELSRDDRIASLRVRVTPNATGSTLSVAIAVVPVDPRLGAFSLTLAVTSAEVLIEELRA
jgi:phage baseplate assembly protein W